ncbi:hypothetical protein [Microcoleus sp.]
MLIDKLSNICGVGGAGRSIAICTRVRSYPAGNRPFSPKFSTF